MPTCCVAAATASGSNALPGSTKVVIPCRSISTQASAAPRRSRLRRSAPPSSRRNSDRAAALAGVAAKESAAGLRVDVQMRIDIARMDDRALGVDDVRRRATVAQISVSGPTAAIVCPLIAMAPLGTIVRRASIVRTQPFADQDVATAAAVRLAWRASRSVARPAPPCSRVPVPSCRSRRRGPDLPADRRSRSRSAAAS